mgnify:CR=1 FL=1
MSGLKLSLGALQYYWPRQTIFDFYEAIAASPVDIVYLGETVCSRRHELRFSDWIASRPCFPRRCCSNRVSK